jgi:hypothetical protein
MYKTSMDVKISIGEVVDKTTILHIKKDRISDPAKLTNIVKEYEYLCSVLQKINITPDNQHYISLLTINTMLWDIEDAIRLKEKKKEFDEEFINIARSVYMTNDKRADVKKQICIDFDSDFVDEKSYEKY